MIIIGLSGEGPSKLGNHEESYGKQKEDKIDNVLLQGVDIGIVWLAA